MSLIIDEDEKYAKIFGKYFTMNVDYYEDHSKDIGFVEKIRSYLLFLQQKHYSVGSDSFKVS